MSQAIPKVVPASDPTVTYGCPPDAVGAQWSIDGAISIPYKLAYGNGCYMQYSFDSSSITVIVEGYFDHGWYSCALDDNPPKWFNANSAQDNLTNRGCYLQGASTGPHNITITNGPESFALSIGNITTGYDITAGNTTSFSSDWPSVPGPPAAPTTSVAATSSIASTLSVAPTAPAVAVSKNRISASAFGATAGVLSVLWLATLAIAVFYWLRERKMQQQLSWAMDMSERATPFPMTPAVPGPRQEPHVAHTTSPPWQSTQYSASVRGQALSTMADSEERLIGGLHAVGEIEPSPAYTPSGTSSAVQT
ncbi:hypothetical protein FRB98_008221, partial [Tulasnella sp. 332]